MSFPAQWEENHLTSKGIKIIPSLYNTYNNVSLFIDIRR